MLIATTSAAWFCSTCEVERDFEQPVCTDEHDSGCPEWCCVRCGSAVLIDAGQVSGVPVRSAALVA